MTTPFMFSRARAGNTALAVVAVPDDDQYDMYHPFGRFCWYVHDDAPNNRWGECQLDMCVHGITLYTRGSHGRVFTAISAEGDVVFIDDPDNVHERIPGTGLDSPDSKFIGRMFDIHTIGQRLYACGDAGQVYRRSIKGVWETLEPSMIQPNTVEATERDFFYCINGPKEEEVYVVGDNGKILVWNGSSFRQIESGTKNALIDIFVENDNMIWICGDNATLLYGNCHIGFRQAPGVYGDHLLLSVTGYQGKIYVGADTGNPQGLLVHDKSGLQKVVTGLRPEGDDCHTVDAANGILWAVGMRDIKRFDGKKWERIKIPKEIHMRKV